MQQKAFNLIVVISMVVIITILAGGQSHSSGATRRSGARHTLFGAPGVTRPAMHRGVMLTPAAIAPAALATLRSPRYSLPAPPTLASQLRVQPARQASVFRFAPFAQVALTILAAPR